MRPAGRLYQACRITLFTRDNCGLCVRAKSALSHVWDSRPFVYHEIDIIKPEFQGWRDCYDMDVPVVRTLASISMDEWVLIPMQIHISKAGAPEENPSLASKAIKLMHRFSPKDIQSKMDEVEKRV